MIAESETFTYSRLPVIRPLSSISILADQLKCSRLHDTFDKPESASGASRRIKAVNFLSENCCWNSKCSEGCKSCSSHCDCRREARSPHFDIDISPIVFDPESDCYNDDWQQTHHRRGSEHCGLSSSNQLCLSTSAPDGPLILHSSDSIWIDPDHKSTHCYPPLNPSASTSCPGCQDIIPPSKRSNRSLSASSASHQQKRSRDRGVSTSNNNVTTTSTSGGHSGRRGNIARPIALRISQQLQARSLAVSGVNSPPNPAFQKMDAQALIASGSVRLRNRIVIPPPSSRLSWHHPISASGGPGSHPALCANQTHRRTAVLPMGRNSILMTDDGHPSELVGGVRLRKPPSLACLSSGSTDFSHRRLSAFTPTQSRRISPHEGNQTTSDFSFSPDVVSSPCQNIASSASSGFFQESSFSHSFSASRLCAEESEEDQTGTVQRNAKACVFSTLYGDRGEGVFFSGPNRDDEFYCQRNCHPSDGDTDESTSPSCFEQSPSSSSSNRCQFQSGALSNHHRHSGCAECANQSILRKNLKRRRCNHNTPDMGHLFCGSKQNDVTVTTVGGSLNEGVFVFGSQRSQLQLSESGTDTPVANSASVAGNLELNSRNLPGHFTSCDDRMDMEVESVDWGNTHSAYSISPLRTQTEFGYSQEDCVDGPAFSILRRNELAGLSEASEEEELNESFEKRRNQQHQLLEYDAGTLTIQTRFRPIRLKNSPSGDDKNTKSCLNPNYPDSSTEGSPCSFTEQLVKSDIYLSRSPDNMFTGDSDTDDEEEDGGFVEITPELSHRVKITPLTLSPGSQMQVEEHASGLPEFAKYHELDIGLIEQD